MSIQGNIGSQCAAEEIRKFIEKKIETHASHPEIVAVLEEIKEKAKEIEETAREGWY